MLLPSILCIGVNADDTFAPTWPCRSRCCFATAACEDPLQVSSNHVVASPMPPDPSLSSPTIIITIRTNSLNILVSSLSPILSGENVRTGSIRSHSLIHSQCAIFLPFILVFEHCIWQSSSVMSLGSFISSMFVSFHLLSAAAESIFAPRCACATTIRANKESDDTIRLVAPNTVRHSFNRLRMCECLSYAWHTHTHTHSHQHSMCSMAAKAIRVSSVCKSFWRIQLWCLICNVHAVHCAKGESHQAECKRRTR